MSFSLQFPDSNRALFPGDIVKLGRFSDKEWTVAYGWYSFGGNREVCGWYLDSPLTHELKPLQKPDLDDIYLIQR